MRDPQRGAGSSCGPPGSPRAVGYRWPAEWEPHEATWLSWPHNQQTWPGCFPSAVAAFASLVAALARSETLHVNVQDAAMEREARAMLDAAGAQGEIHFHHFVTNDAWCRDHGAMLLVRDGVERTEGKPPALPPRVALDWEYNAWGRKYPPFTDDNAIPAKMATALEVPGISCPMVLEGGSVDGNGQGVLLTTESCLLHPNRNPHLDRGRIEAILCEMLAVDSILWLGSGIAGDDTDGHVDDFARFVASDRVALVEEPNPRDDNYAPLRESRARLDAWRDPRGSSLEIVPLPSPRPMMAGGDRLPASYANFYIANRVVVVPQFQDPADRIARQTLAEIFPEREVVGIDCRDLIRGLGGLHCLTQQVPAAS